MSQPRRRQGGAPALDTSEVPCGPIAWVLTPADLEQLLEEIASAGVAVLDLETTGLDEHARLGGVSNEGFPARIVLASLTLAPPLDETEDPAEVEPGEGSPTTWVIPLSHPMSPWQGRWRAVVRRIAEQIVEHRVPLLNQNVKFDCRWVYRHSGDKRLRLKGIDLSRRIVWDTQVSSHLLDQNSSTRLKDRAPATFGIASWADFDLTYPGAAEKVDLWALGAYAARDTYWTWRLAIRHRTQMWQGFGADDGGPETDEDGTAARLGDIATWVSAPAVASMTALEQRGILVDVDWVHERLRTESAQAAQLLQEMAEHYGMPAAEASAAPTSRWFTEWSERAVDSGDLVVASLTPSGKPQWNKSVLVRQARAGSAVAQKVLDQRKADKRSSFLRSWLDRVTPEGALHSTYHLGRVVTGRLSSSNPNMQQIEKEMRQAFIARPGYVLLDLDYAQIELRVAAFISRCAPMLDAFQRGDDLHRLFAARLTGKDPADITDKERFYAKPANFGLLYGMGGYGFREYAEDAYAVSFTEEEAFAVRDAWFEMWEGMSDWHERAAAQARRTGYCTSPIGRIRYLPDIWSDNEYLRSFAERAAINSPVQGFASDLMLIAAASISGHAYGSRRVRGAHPVATVHDSIVVEAREDRWERIAQECRERMEQPHAVLRKLGCKLDVPLVADVVAGRRWGAGDLSAAQT